MQPEELPLIEANLQKIIQNRISTRAFLDKPVSNEQLKQLVYLANRAPSWKNAQSYRLYFITGRKKQQLLTEFQRAIEQKKQPQPTYPYEKNHPAPFKKRMFSLGMDLYNHMGIDRKDKEAREQHFLLNYQAFGAPVIGFFYIPGELAEWTILDLGIFMGHICLVAEAMGLATCFQASLAVYPDIVAKYTGASDKFKLIVGMALGYADPDDRNNSFHSRRADISEIMQII